MRDKVKGNTEAHRGLSRVYTARGQFGQAIAELETVIRLQTSGETTRMAAPAIYDDLAHAQERAGQDACGSFLKAVESLRFGEYSGNPAELRANARRCRSQAK